MVSSQLVRAWIVENRRFGALPKILDFAFDSDENKRFVTSMDGFVLTVIVFLILLSNVGVRIEVLESVGFCYGGKGSEGKTNRGVDLEKQSRSFVIHRFDSRKKQFGIEKKNKMATQIHDSKWVEPSSHRRHQ